jgi:hypothetical protein
MPSCLPAWRISAAGCTACRLGVRDMGVKFHPKVELELVERVKRRRTERRDAAQQVPWAACTTLHSASATRTWDCPF